MSQRKLGMAAGIDEFSANSRITHYEKGRHLPDFQTMERLARILDHPTAYFYTRDDDLAELIVLAGQLTPKERNRLLLQLRRRKTGATA